MRSAVTAVNRTALAASSPDNQKVNQRVRCECRILECSVDRDKHDSCVVRTAMFVRGVDEPPTRLLERPLLVTNNRRELVALQQR